MPPFKIAELMQLIADRKSGYKLTEVKELATFTPDQEAKIKRAMEEKLRTVTHE